MGNPVILFALQLEHLTIMATIVGQAVGEFERAVLSEDRQSIRQSLGKLKRIAEEHREACESIRNVMCAGMDRETRAEFDRRAREINEPLLSLDNLLARAKGQIVGQA